MHRKLLQTVRALSLSLGLLMIGLIATNPDTIAPSIAVPGAEAGAAVTPVLLETGLEAAKAHNRHSRVRSQDAMVLPFFSFAQGLRRNNRS